MSGTVTFIYGNRTIPLPYPTPVEHTIHSLLQCTFSLSANLKTSNLFFLIISYYQWQNIFAKPAFMSYWGLHFPKFIVSTLPLSSSSYCIIGCRGKKSLWLL